MGNPKTRRNKNSLSNTQNSAYDRSMVQALKETVRIQPGGRIELISSELPEGAEAEVIVLVEKPSVDPRASFGLFSDDPALMDQVVADAMASRAHPLRLERG